MTNQIGTYITQQLSPILPIMLDEDATASYPYAVYSLDVAEQFTKSGPYRIYGTAHISIYADDYDTLKAKLDAVIATMNTSFRTHVYRGKQTTVRSTCEDGVWLASIDYIVMQYNN